MMEINLEKTWLHALRSELDAPYFEAISQYLAARRAVATVLPPPERIFAAFNAVLLPDVKIVLLGQDPYHRAGQAIGLSFAVAKGVRVPPSLKNIYKELYSDLQVLPPPHGDLSAWAAQGVLLLNAALTVEEGQPNAHQKIGWTQFTDAVITTISRECSGVVFLLWGNFAQAKAPLIDAEKHLILAAAHPSPLARGAFFGSKPFSKANDYLLSQNKKPIDWQII